MGGINTGKLIVGGLVAGLVINICQSAVHLFLFAEQSAALTENMGLPQPTGGQIGMYWVLSFVGGLALIFVYAGFRPRFGAGAGTAVLAAGTTWVMAEVIPAMFNIVSGMFGFAAYLPFMLSMLVILVIAALAGGAVYSED